MGCGQCILLPLRTFSAHGFVLFSRGRSVKLARDRSDIANNKFFCIDIDSCSISSRLPMVQREPPQAVWRQLAQSFCTILSEVEARRARKQNIDCAKRHHTRHCWLPAKVVYPANSSKRFSWLTRPTAIFVV